MSPETPTLAIHYRLLKCATQIKECQSHHANMYMMDWCACYRITKTNLE